MDTLEKVDAIEKSGLQVAFDGCHKLYICEDVDDQNDALANGYSLYPADRIRSLLDDSCGLVFVNNWALNGGSWVGPMTIEQGELHQAGYYGPEYVEDGEDED